VCLTQKTTDKGGTEATKKETELTSRHKNGGVNHKLILKKLQALFSPVGEGGKRRPDGRKLRKGQKRKSGSLQLHKKLTKERFPG